LDTKANNIEIKEELDLKASKLSVLSALQKKVDLKDI
jgi:hypothetical protein